jgi:hypothetical protein
MNRKISIDNNQHIFGNYNQNNNPAFFGTQALHYNACATDRANPNRIIGNNMDRRVSHHVMHTDNAIGRLSTTSTKDKNKPFFNGQYLNHLHPHTTLLPHHMNMNSEKSM